MDFVRLYGFTRATRLYVNENLSFFSTQHCRHRLFHVWEVLRHDINGHHCVVHGRDVSNFAEKHKCRDIFDVGSIRKCRSSLLGIYRLVCVKSIVDF